MERNEQTYAKTGIVKLHLPFLCGSMIFYMLFYLALFLYSLSVKKADFYSKDIIDAIIFMAWIPMFLVSVIEYFYQGRQNAREFLLTLPYKQGARGMTVFLGDFFVMAIPYFVMSVLLYLGCHLRLGAGTVEVSYVLPACLAVLHWHLSLL